MKVAIIVICIGFIGGCLPSDYRGVIEDDGVPPPSGGGGEDFEQSFEIDVQPALESQCDSCHKDGIADAPRFGVGYDAYVEYNQGALFDCDVPQESLLIAKGMHNGPAFNSSDRQIIGDWLAAWSMESDTCSGQQ